MDSLATSLHGAASEQVRYDRKAPDEVQSGVAQATRAGARGPEEMVERVDGRLHGERGLRPAARIAAKERRVPGALRRRPGGEDLGEDSRILQAEVQALPGQRMNDARGVSPERDARGRNTTGRKPAQRIAHGCAEKPKLPQASVRRALDLAAEPFLVEREQACRGVLGERPDHGDAVPGQRQQSEYRAPLEPLEGGVPMRALAGKVGHPAGRPVAMPKDGSAGGPP